MAYIEAETDADNSLLWSWGGPDLVNFMKMHAKVILETIPAVGETPQTLKDTYAQAITKIRAELHRLVNRTLAMHELINTKQGNRTWLEFYSDIETKAQNLEFDTVPYTHKDAVKDALIMGMDDRKLMERALSEDPDHDTLMKWGQAREAGKEGVHSLAGGHSSTNRIENIQDMSDDEIDDMIETLSIMKIRKQGKYSGRPRTGPPKPQQNHCRNCTTEHPQGRCPARGRDCFACGGLHHFNYSEACPETRKTFARKTVNRFQNQPDDPDDYADTVMNPTSATPLKMISTVGRLETKHQSKQVTIKLGGVKQTLYTDTGSDYTIIPPSHYAKEMGPLCKPDTKLRAWGSSKLLDVQAMVHTKLETEKGATTNTKVYIVDGYQPEPLLGDLDAAELGFVTFHKEGREPTEEEQGATVYRNHSIPEKVRQGLNV